MEFRDMLVKARKEKGYNQEELAEKIGVSRQAVSKWETGDAQPALAQLIALADALDISLDVLCGRIDPNTTDVPATTSAPSGDTASATGEATPISTDAKHQAEHSFSLKVAFLPLLLSVLIVAGMFFHMSSAIAEAEDAALKNELPSTIEVTGVMFYVDTARNDTITYEFTPSIVSSDLDYTLSFIGFDRQVHSFEVENDNGIFHGAAKLPSGYGSYTVTLEISNENESRAVALATGLVFDESRASWNPVGEP